jgi:hypothetical protein
MNVKKGLMALIIAANCFSAQAANVILLNEYVKAGVNETTGTLGSGGNTSPGLLYDSTGTGTFNTAYDYLTPGSPFEGFAVKALDGSTVLTQIHNNNAGYTEITGAWVGTPTSSSAVWSSTSNAYFNLQNSYSLPSGKQYLDISTQIEAKQAIGTLYFARFIDPDARAAAGDSSSTDNVRGYGVIPKANVVFSEALSSRYALGLYTTVSTGSNTSISPGWSSDPTDYYSNTSGHDVVRGDYTIGIAFTSSSLAVGDIVTYSYAYIFGPSAFASASTAISGGAGGGTPGTSPFTGTLTDVGSATSAASAPSTPTVTGTTTSTITVSDTTAASTTLPVITASLAHHDASEGSGKQTIARETTTNVTTPMERVLVTKVRTTTNYSDGTSTYSDSADTTTITVTNSVATSVDNESFSGRIDQQEKLSQMNIGINRMLNSDAFRKDLFKGEHGRMWLSVDRLNSGLENGYNGNSNRFGIGFEKDVKDNWILGVQYNRVNTSMKGVDSNTAQDKNHVGLYSIYTLNDFKLKTDLGIANNQIKSNRTIENIFDNSHSTNGRDVWLSNRLYSPDMKGFRPYVGYTVGSNKRDGYTEAGSIQSFRTVGKTSENVNYAELGMRYEKRYGNFTAAAEGGVTSDQYKDLKASLSYDVNKDSFLVISAGRQTNNDLSTNVFGINGVIRF